MRNLRIKVEWQIIKCCRFSVLCFTDSSVGKEAASNAGDPSTITGLGRPQWRRNRLPTPVFLGFPCGSAGKESACNAGDLGSIGGLGRSQEKGKATHSSILAWRIPWTVQFMGSQRVRHDWATFFFFYSFFFNFYFFISCRLITFSIVVGFVIHWHESAMDLHVFPILIPPPTSLSTRSLWVFPVHQAPALVSCIQPGLVICFTIVIL